MSGWGAPYRYEEEEDEEEVDNDRQALTTFPGSQLGPAPRPGLPPPARRHCRPRRSCV